MAANQRTTPSKFFCHGGKLSDLILVNYEILAGKAFKGSNFTDHAIRNLLF